MPTLIFVNKVDTGHVDLETVVARIEAGLGCQSVAVNWPEMTEDDDDFTWFGAWSLIDGRWLPAEDGAEAESHQSELTGVARDVRAGVLERLAELDEALLAKWLDDAPADRDDLVRVLRKAVTDEVLYPVVFGSASIGHGVDTLLGAIATLLPEPQLRHDGTGTDSGPFLRVLKVEPRGRELLALVRVLSGAMTLATPLHASGGPDPLPVRMLGRVQGRDLIEVPYLPAGSLGGLILAMDPQVAPLPGAILASTPGQSVPPPASSSREEPVVWCFLDAATPEDHATLVQLLSTVSSLDPSITIRRDPATGQMSVGGRGELQLDVLYQRLALMLGGPERLRRGPFRVRRVRTLRRPVAGASEAIDAQTGLRWHLVATLHSALKPGVDVPAGLQLDDARRGALDAGVEFARDLAMADAGLEVGPVRLAIETIDSGEPDRAIPPPPVLRELAVRAARTALAAGRWRVTEPWVRFDALVPWPAIGRFQGELARRGIQPPRPTEPSSAGQRFSGITPLGPLLGFTAIFREFAGGFGWLSLAALPTCDVPDAENGRDEAETP